MRYFAPDTCCFRCSNPDCGQLTCYVETCANYQFWADPVAGLCGLCAKPEESL